SRLPAILADLYAHDPLLGPALASGLATEAMAKVATAPSSAPTMALIEPQTLAGYQRAGQDAARTLGTTLARFMTEPDGPQIAAVSLDGFDTHANQGAAEGQLAVRLA